MYFLLVLGAHYFTPSQDAFRRFSAPILRVGNLSADQHVPLLLFQDLDREASDGSVELVRPKGRRLPKPPADFSPKPAIQGRAEMLAEGCVNVAH